MNDADRTKFGPPDDTPMLPWFGGAFSHGFVALHPFVAIEGLHPGVCEYGTLILPRSSAPPDVDLLEWVDGEAEERRDGKEVTASSVDEIAVRFGNQVSWREICHLAGLSDHCALDQALRTIILGLRKDLEDQTSAERLKKFCDQNALFRPTEGRFQPIMQANLIDLFERVGVSEVFVGDEFGDDERLVTLATLGGELAWDRRTDLSSWGIRRIYAPDQSILVWVHWDSFYTAVFATAERLDGSRLDELFEGFWCSNETSTYWLTQPAIPLTQ
ncbi:DUF2711 family protein [Sphingomonas sp. C3-2]|uniref:DUF2711 family protein n=1 Tax=Sphingomonas sp. C3-2 TaxID=3062169 RepID=UPI00294B7C40|nr:DUF2711 family protein [Sphingomonas sp. C3-2]WOK38009.1 DUF2711 family protein [Sphingomonas sp. C3-2]